MFRSESEGNIAVLNDTDTHFSTLVHSFCPVLGHNPRQRTR